MIENFDVGLARKVMDQIRTEPETWRQGSWRCGSGMCFAGWTAQLAGLRWVAPATHMMSDYVAVPCDRAVEMMGERYARCNRGSEIRSCEYHFAQWAGATPDVELADDEVLISAEHAASYLLTGSSESDVVCTQSGRDLFEGTNSLKDLEKILEELTGERL